MLDTLNGLPDTVMHTFLQSVQQYYFNNYYHNSIHAIDVTNSCAFFLNCGFKSMLSQVGEDDGRPNARTY